MAPGRERRCRVFASRGADLTPRTPLRRRAHRCTEATWPGLERHHGVTARRLGLPMRDHQHAAVPGRRLQYARPRARSASAGSSPLVGSSSTRSGPGARRARATARRRRSPPERATPSSPTGVSSPAGQRGTQASSRAARKRGGDLLVGGVGAAQGQVGPHACRRTSGPAGRPGRTRPGRRPVAARSTSTPPSDRRALLEGPVAQERVDQARLAGAARPGHRHPARRRAGAG